MKHFKVKALSLLSVILIFSGCGSTSAIQPIVESNIAMDSASTNLAGGYGSYDKNDYNYIIGSEYAESTTEEVTQSSVDAEITLLEEKLVYSCDIDIETKVYQESYNNLKSLFGQYNVVIESEVQRDSDYDWYYEDDYQDATLSSYIKCRVPSKQYNDFVTALNSLGENTKVIRQSSEVQNISQAYYDNKTQIESLQIQETRLLSMLESATTIEDMIRVEDRLQEVQYELNSLQTQLMYMDLDVAYSYVNINLEEVKELSKYKDETTFLSRVIGIFKDTWDYAVELFEGLIEITLHLIPITLFIIIPLFYFIKLIFFLIKKVFGNKLGKLGKLNIFSKKNKKDKKDDIKL